MSLTVLYLGIVFIFGVVIGSFLNVVIYRLHTGKSLNDRSHCLSCQESLRWFDLFPVLSYICLCGRCRRCGAHIPMRYVVVELLTGVSFVYLFTVFGHGVLFYLWLLLAAVLIVAIVYDIYHMIIPNELPIVLTVASVTFLAVSWPAGVTLHSLYLPILSALVLSGFYATLWLISKGRWLGLGDAKLAFPLGLLLTLGEVFSTIVLSFWIGAVVAVGLLGYQAAKHWITSQRYARATVANYSRYFTMKSEIPFAPFLVAAFLVVYFGSADVLMLTEYVISILIN